MFERLRNKRNYKKSLKAHNIYAIVCYADWCVREYKFANKWVWDIYREEYVPMVYHYDDHNGEYETIRPTKMTLTTTGNIVGWTFNRERAETEVYKRKVLERLNYGKTFKY